MIWTDGNGRIWIWYVNLIRNMRTRLDDFSKRVRA